MSSECVHLQEQALNALRPQGSPNRVATFGNTLVEDVGDWVEIRVENFPTQVRIGFEFSICNRPGHVVKLGPIQGMS